MKKFTYLIVALLFTVSAMAQTDLEQKVTQLEQNFQRLEQRVGQLDAKLTEQIERNDRLQEALDIRSLGNEIKKDDVTIRITKVTQDLAAGELRIEGLMTYNGSKKRELHFPEQELVDVKGNVYTTYTVVQPKDESKELYINNAATDLPYAFVIKFEGIQEKLPTVGLLRVQVWSSRLGGKESFDFKGVKVDWK